MLRWTSSLVTERGNDRGCDYIVGAHGDAETIGKFSGPAIHDLQNDTLCECYIILAQELSLNIYN